MKINHKHLLIAILLLASILRIFNLGAGDVTGSDEVLYSFRSLGMLDFDEAEFQTTPLEWFDADTRKGIVPEAEHPNFGYLATTVIEEIPSWTKFSFHDHPPIVFIVQNLFMKIFGETNFAFRLPSALFGIASIYLLYLIAARLFSRNIGLLAAALMAVTVNHVYISRIGIQEAYVIFFMLLAIWLFLKALDPFRANWSKPHDGASADQTSNGAGKDHYLIWTGVALGLAFLTKYTTFILVPIFLTYLLISKRHYFLNWKLWAGTLLALLLFTPVIAYNINLYDQVGHFDFQFSFIFGQNPEVWESAPGKEEIGTLGDRISNFIPNLLSTNSWLFLTMFALSLIYFGWQLFKKNYQLFKNKFFIDLALIWLVILLLFIGPTFRFLTMLTPFIAIKIALFLALVVETHGWKKILSAIILPLLFFEVIYTTNSQLTNYPAGPEFWTWSEVRFENYNWGYNELDKYLKNELDGKMPLLAFDTRYSFLRELREKSLAREREKGTPTYPAMIIYDNNFQNAAQLWILDRLQVYHGWPVIKLEEYESFLRQNGEGYFANAGIKKFYFIIPTDKVPLKKTLTDLGAQLDAGLTNIGRTPISITNKRGEEAFRVYAL